ncbi:hypothetical protein F0562_016434 [Nyssa sinensis]|uniref:Glycosyltransferases n=1 Tax=Nyssa sinensis TaxID=561372 RepID=A0A5J4ZMS7_9ASTE|nr:hypothetical protein F0562_016434 [Nyssa sinensis]
MGSQDRSKKKVQLWKKAIVHFSLCFVMGFFSGFAPTLTGKASIFSGHNIFATNRSEFSPQPIEMLHQARIESGNFNRSMMDDHDHETPVAVPTRSNEMDHPKTLEEEKEELELIPRRLIIIITPTSSKDHHHHLQEVLLMRLANTLKLVPPPLLWVVVEAQSGSSELSEMLRKTGIMYRHLVFKENFTDPEVEMDHQRNVALKHIEQHKLSWDCSFCRTFQRL